MFEKEKEKYIGVMREISDEINKKNNLMRIVKFLSQMNWEDVDNKTIIKVDKVINDDEECEQCNEKYSEIETLKDNFDEFAFDIWNAVVRAVKYQIELIEQNKDDENEKEYALSRMKEIISDDYKNIVKKYSNFIPGRY